MNITLGCDPELFLRNEKGEIGSSIGLIPGTKDEPRAVPMGAVQSDNILAEFNTNCAYSQREFCLAVNSVQHSLKQFLPEGWSLDRGVSCAAFTPEQMSEWPDSAFIFGCERDFDIWTGRPNPSPSADTNLRSAGGHVHIGGISLGRANYLVRYLDYRLLLPAVLMDTTEGSSTRPNIYGRPGCYRPKVYGCEYRSLSNFWIHEKKYVKWVASTTVHAAKYVDKHIRECIKAVPPEELHEVILSKNTGAAKKLIAKLAPMGVACA